LKINWEGGEGDLNEVGGGWKGCETLFLVLGGKKVPGGKPQLRRDMKHPPIKVCQGRPRRRRKEPKGEPGGGGQGEVGGRKTSLCGATVSN